MAAPVATHQGAESQHASAHRAPARASTRASGVTATSALSRPQHAPGNRATYRLLGATLQTKLTIGPADDPFEREADRVADTVMRMPDTSAGSSLQRSPAVVQRACTGCEKEIHRQADEEPGSVSDERDELAQAKPLTSSGSSIGPGQIQRACSKCEEAAQHVQRQVDDERDQLVQSSTLAGPPGIQREAEGDEEMLQASGGVGPQPAAHAALEATIEAQQGGGQSLPSNTRDSLESRFGADFGHVRVHTDSRAADAARSIHARAFTVGQDISFGSGQFAPESADGQRLLAHELTHVLQQGSGVRRQLMMKRGRGGGARKKTKIDIKTARSVMRWVLETINQVRPSERSPWKGDPSVVGYEPLLSLWEQLTYGSASAGKTTKLEGHNYIAAFELARALTEPIVRLVYQKGGGTERELLVTKWAPKYYEFEKRAESEKRILHLIETTTSFPFDPEAVDTDEFLRVATANETRPMVLQRGAGIRVGTAVAGKVYHASQQEPRLVLWAGPAGLFYEEQGAIFKQSQAGFSNDIILGVIIKAAQDIGPFVALMTAIVDIAISLIPGIGTVYDLTKAAKAALEGNWKEAALEILPGPALAGIGKVAKVAKATRVGGAAFKVGAQGAKLVGRAFTGAATFLGRGMGWVKGKVTRGMWIVTEGTAGAAKGKGYHFLGEGETAWKSVDEVDAAPFIKCSKCDITPVGKGEVPPPAPTAASKADVPSLPAGTAARAWDDPALVEDLAVDLYRKSGVKKPLPDDVVRERFKKGYRFDPAKRRWTKPHKPRSARPPRAPTEPFMRDALEKVSRPGPPPHPLHRLVEGKPGAGGKTSHDWWKTERVTKSGKKQRGRYEGAEDAPVVQAGHADAYASGAEQRYMLEDADLNQLTGQTIESKGAFSQKIAVDVDGVPVDLASLQLWERLGVVDPGTVAKAVAKATK